MKELNDIVSALKDEMSKLLETLSRNTELIQTTTLRKFQAEIDRFVQVMETSCENINTAGRHQNETLANIAGTVQASMQNGARDIQNEFNHVHTAIREVMTSAAEDIKTNYQANMRKMFEAMADNLAAITQQLREAGNAQTEAKS